MGRSDEATQVAVTQGCCCRCCHRARRGPSRVPAEGGATARAWLGRHLVGLAGYNFGKMVDELMGMEVDAMPSCVGYYEQEFLVDTFFAFFNVVPIFFGLFVDTGHVQSDALARHYP